MSDKRVAGAVGVAGAILYAARKLTHLERVDGGWLIEWKDGTHIPSEVVDRQKDVYEELMRGVRRTRPQLVMDITNPNPFGAFARRHMEAYMGQKKYPYRDGDHLVLGPEIFTDVGKQVICWKGTNYVPQEDPDTKLRPSLQYQASVRLVEKQLVLTDAQKATLEVLDEMASVTLHGVEAASAHGATTRSAARRRGEAVVYDATLTLQDEGGCSPMFVMLADGSLHPVDDDFDEDEEL